MCGRSEDTREEEKKTPSAVLWWLRVRWRKVFLQKRRRLLNFSLPTVLSCCDEDGESINGEANEGCDDGVAAGEEKRRIMTLNCRNCYS